MSQERNERMTNEEIIEQLENAIELIKQDGKDWLDDRDTPILEACIKSLTALDKIRAEIEQIKEAEHQVYGKSSWRFVDKCLDVIDKYMAESKEQEDENVD